MIKIPTFLRAHEWWGPKIIPLLCIGYATIIQHDDDIIPYFLWLLFLIIAVAVGAIYVSVLNDLTDLKYDIASNKKNRLEYLSSKKRKSLLITSVLISVVFSCFFINDALSLIFYLSAYLAFSLYSISPFRFKNRGILGVIADACGAHLFPSLFIVSSMFYHMETPVDLYWLIIIGVWAFTYGLRGILWHQVLDRDNDMSINHKTFATEINVSAIKPLEIIISFIEIVALILILSSLGMLTFVALLFYILMLFGYRKLKIKTIMIISKDGEWQILMTDFYLTLLPLSLIITCSIKNPLNLILLIFHFICFYYTIKAFIKNILRMIKG